MTHENHTKVTGHLLVHHVSAAAEFHFREHLGHLIAFTVLNVLCFS